MSSGIIRIANGNTVYCSGKNTSLYLPELAECQNVLGTKGAFALDLYIIGAKGAYNFEVFGKANSSAPSTSADLLSNDHGSMSITMSEGDVLNLKLIYNGSISFYAYIVSHMK